jgi:hypothetical protein
MRVSHDKKYSYIYFLRDLLYMCKSHLSQSSPQYQHIVALYSQMKLYRDILAVDSRYYIDLFATNIPRIGGKHGNLSWKCVKVIQ